MQKIKQNDVHDDACKAGVRSPRMNYHEVTDNSDGVRIKSKTIVSGYF